MRFWLALVVVLLLLSTVLLFAAFVEGGTLAPKAPSPASPPWPLLSSVPATYDAADGYDLWFLPDGATWTYAHGTWSNITSTGGTPTGMSSNVAMTYDARDGYVLLFGGSLVVLPYSPLANTWTFQAGHWTNRTASVVGAPPPRLLGLMTYDSEDRVVVLFGGGLPGVVPALSDTWTYAGGTWTNATVPGPPPVAGHSGSQWFYGFVDDPTDGYVLFYHSGNCPAYCPLVWTYHGGVWTNRTSTISPLPLMQLFVLFDFDSTTGHVVAQAGCTNTSSYTCAHRFGTFVFNGSGWSDVTPSTPTPWRLEANWVDDPSDGGVMLVAGCCWADFSGLSLSYQDTWIYAHGSWSESEPWGGGTPSGAGNDGTWMGFGLVSISVVLAAVALRRRPPSGP